MADTGGARFIKDEKKFLPDKKLKDSEISMLFILAIVAVAVLGVYFILFPMYTNMNSLTNEIDEMQAKEFEYRDQIAMTEIYQKQFKEAQSDYNSFFNYFHSPMDPEIIDERITSMLIAHNMTPASLSMSTLMVEGVPPYVAQELLVRPVPDITEPQEDSTTTSVPPVGDTGDMPYEGAEAADASLADPDDSIPADNYAFVYTITLSAYGNRDNLYTFLAQAATMTAMKIVAFDFTDPETTTDSDGKSTTNPGEINMQIKMYVLIDGVPAREFGAGEQ